MPNGAEVVAAGAVIVRRGGEKHVLLVHRPKYDDWSFPKGKREPGEHVTTTAVREVLEETGVEIRLGRPLAEHTYPLSSGRSKRVHYWVGEVVGDDDVSTYQINAEVDDLLWCPLGEAANRLSYPEDRALLEDFAGGKKRTDALVVLRHGEAFPRKQWRGDDRARPLAEAGRAQAEALVPVLHAYGVSRLVTSPSLRCVHTLIPYADTQVLALDEVAGLSEEDHTESTVTEIVGHLLDVKESAVLCTHRPVLPVVFDALGLEVEPLAPGEMLVVHHRRGRIHAVERHAPG